MLAHTGVPRFCAVRRAVSWAALAAGGLPAANPGFGQAAKWTAPRTADGHPDLQGIWTNATLTPLERPA
ncbi:MAG TPA: hypothetical protein VN841_17055 [Bryobacteraceae bacterium]|nr:hypothetical protein [Bryobacteraceae bacterium]